jgi:hypothetical protein
VGAIEKELAHACMHTYIHTYILITYIHTNIHTYKVGAIQKELEDTVEREARQQEYLKTVWLTT